MGESASGIAVAMVMFDQVPALQAELVKENLARSWSGDRSVSGFESDGDTLSLSVGEGFGAISIVPAPIPWPELETACQIAWYWPEAADSLRAHRAHAIVTVGGPAPDSAQRLSDLTRLTASLAATHNAVGVYWGSSRMVRASEEFVKLSEDLENSAVKAFLWVNVVLSASEGGKLNMSTYGLQSLGLMELEANAAEVEEQWLLSKAYDVASYLMENGPVIADGDTIGESAAEKIRIQHAPSRWEPTQMVYRMELQARGE